MWIIKCHRNVIAPAVQRFITIIIVSNKFIFFICGCQKLFKKVSIIILPLWQRKKDKGQAVPSSFRRRGSFYRQRMQRVRKCKEIWVAFWKGHVLSVTPTEDFYPGDSWCLVGASVRYLKSAGELEPGHLCQISTRSMTVHETEPNSWFSPSCCVPSFSFRNNDDGMLPALPLLSG